MTASTSRLELRYQPNSDLLVGRVERPLADHHDTIEQPDADLSLSYATVGDETMLTSFRMLHASRRLDVGDVTDLHPNVLRVASELVTDSLAHVEHDDASAVVAHRTVTIVDVDVADLRRRRAPLDTSGLDPLAARRVAHAVSRVAAAIEQLPTPATTLESRRHAHLVVTLQELASALDDGAGRTAPGSSAAARDAVRGGLPLSRNEQIQLREALVLIDDAMRWPAAIAAFDDLVRSFAGPRDDGHP